MAEGARLESVFRGNSNLGSNPSLSATMSNIHTYKSISKYLCLRIIEAKNDTTAKTNTTGILGQEEKTPCD